MMANLATNIYDINYLNHHDRADVPRCRSVLQTMMFSFLRIMRVIDGVHSNVS